MNAKHTRGLPGIIGAAALVCSVPASAQRMPADLDPDSGARLPHLTAEEIGPDGQRLVDIFAPNGGPVGGPLAFAAYNPHVATALLDLHDGSVTMGSLDADVRELAILVACRETNYTFEWNAHAGFAVTSGVDESVIDVVRNDESLAGVPDKHAVVIRFGRELLRDRKMSSETFASAVEHFGERGAMDLVAVMMTYAVSGFYAIAVDEHPPGQEMLMPLN